MSYSDEQAEGLQRDVTRLRQQVRDMAHEAQALRTRLAATERVRDQLAERAALRPAEHLAYLAAKAQVERGHSPGFNTTTALMLTVGRLSGLSADVLVSAPDTGPVTSTDGDDVVAIAAATGTRQT